MSEVLAVRRKDISDESLRGFEGMIGSRSRERRLIAAPEAIIAKIVGNMPDAHRRFLISFERGEPDWALVGVPSAGELPAVKWRQQNLDRLTKEKRAILVKALDVILRSTAARQDRVPRESHRGNGCPSRQTKYRNEVSTSS
jgi:hypothetical protein